MTATAPATVSSFAWLLGYLDAVGSQPTGRHVRQCPAHGDSAPSLSLGQGADGRLLLHCHAGCGWREVFAALGLPAKYLRQPPAVAPDAYAHAFAPPVEFPKLDRGSRNARGRRTGASWKLTSRHRYGERWCLFRYRHETTGEKDLEWWSLNPKGDAVPGLLGTPLAELPLYGQHDLALAIGAGEPVLLVESESSVDALRRHGWYATTWAGGAGTPQVGRVAEVLGDYPGVVVIPDHDRAGLVCRDRLLTVGRPGWRVLLPAEGEDARDLFDHVGPEAFRALIERTDDDV